MTPDDELLERARRAREASRTARQRANAALARIENADIYRLRTYPVIEITLGLGNDLQHGTRLRRHFRPSQISRQLILRVTSKAKTKQSFLGSAWPR